MDTIEIRTPQNVTIEYELASLRERCTALLFDIFIVLFVYAILAFVLSLFFSFIGSGDAMLRIMSFLPLVLFFLYQLFFELLADGQSIGKKSVGIKVVRIDGREPGLGEHLLRAIFHLIDTFPMGIIGALSISASPNRQRLGDMTANTAVIKVQFNMRYRLEEIMKINTLEDYEITYPDVKNLSEQDMLLIKRILSRYSKYRNQAHQTAINELTSTLTEKLDIKHPPQNKIDFLKTLINDYIVMTR